VQVSQPYLPETQRKNKLIYLNRPYRTQENENKDFHKLVLVFHSAGGQATVRFTASTRLISGIAETVSM
jgi:hypothetical protein